MITVIDTLNSIGEYPVVKSDDVQHSGERLNSVISRIESNMVVKQDSKTLSSNDYTNSDKLKLSGIESGATKTIVDDSLTLFSNNPVQNKVITSALNSKANNSDISDINARVTANESNISEQSARIDSIISLPEGSTTGDAELIDIRVGVDGNTYETAGDAVRSQVSDVKGDIKKLYVQRNKFNPSTIKSDVYRNASTGEETEKSGWCCSEKINVYSGEKYFINKEAHVCFYDASGNFISGKESTWEFEFTIPNNASYMFVSINKSNTSSVILYTLKDYKISDAYEPYELSHDFKSCNNYSDYKLKHLSDLLITGKNKYNKNKTTNGYYYNFSSGEKGENSNQCYSERIPVISEMNYIISHPAHICFFDKDNNFISGTLTNSNFDGNWYPAFFKTPSNTDNMIVSVAISSKSAVMLEIGNLQSDYESYKETYENFNSEISNSYITKLLMVEKNKLNSAASTDGFFIFYSNGSINANSTYCYSEMIPVIPGVKYTFSNNNSHVCFYDKYKNFVSGVLTADGMTFETPDNTYYLIVSYPIGIKNEAMLNKGETSMPYEPYKESLNGESSAVTAIDSNNSSSVKYIPNSFRVGNQPEICIPSTIYCTVNESFSIYFRNVTKLSANVYSAYEYLVSRWNGSYWVGFGAEGWPEEAMYFDYMFRYTPATAKTEKIKFELFDPENNAIVSEKIVDFISTNPSSISSSKKSPTIITIGDSFCDGYSIASFNVVQHIYHTLVDTGYTPNMIGVNYSGIDGVSDDAWASWGNETFCAAETGYLRPDRLLSDAIWDSGWGKNEPNGWHDGDTYSTISSEQRSHGHTKNQFYNNSLSGVNKFDFGYYMSGRHSNAHVDFVLLMAGLNDCLWYSGNTSENSFTHLLNYIDAMITSIHSYDSSIKIVIGLVTPQKQGDNFSGYYNGVGSSQYKRNQEIYNKMIIDHFDTTAYKNSKVHVLANHAHFDTRFGSYSQQSAPCKFMPNYKEDVTLSIHPSEIGCKYIADSVRNYIVGLSE